MQNKQSHPEGIESESEWSFVILDSENLTDVDKQITDIYENKTYLSDFKLKDKIIQYQEIRDCCSVTIWTLIFINVYIYLMWCTTWITLVCPYCIDKRFSSCLKKYRLSSIKMLTYFANYETNPWPSLILSSFSHAAGFHILFNMMIFYIGAKIVGHYMTCWNILPIYVAGGFACSAASIYGAKYLKREAVHGLGASGSVFCLLTVAAVQEPTLDQMRFLIDMPEYSKAVGLHLWFFVVLQIASDVYGLAAGGRKTDYWGHIGGMGVGFLIGLFYKLFTSIQDHISS